jgi:polyamine oxidase
MYPTVTIPAPTDFYFKSWDEDPLFRGSYANWPPSFLEEKHTNLRADVRQRVWFAGEAGSKLYFGELRTPNNFGFFLVRIMTIDALS